VRQFRSTLALAAVATPNCVIRNQPPPRLRGQEGAEPANDDNLDDTAAAGQLHVGTTVPALLPIVGA